MDKRLTEISSVLGDYSRGNFLKVVGISPQLDEIDGISSNVNMLGEELKAAMISKNYFNNIFNAVTDIVLVLNNRGIIEDANQAAETQTQYDKIFLRGKALNTISIKGLPHFRKLWSLLKLNQSSYYNFCRLKTRAGTIIPVSVKLAYFDDDQLGKCILLTATDISYRMKTENLIIRAIIDIQEKERVRLSQDLHDSIIQQLAGVKFFITATARFISDPEHKEILGQANTAMAETMAEIRNICFNLMPKSLQEFGLVKAVEVFCDYMSKTSRVAFEIRENPGWPDLLSTLNIDLYRVIQEITQNAVRHGKAGKITIVFSSNKNNLFIKVTDNGKGFDKNKSTNGTGLKNIESRVRSHDGKIELTSRPGKGTAYLISIPLN